MGMKRLILMQDRRKLKRLKVESFVQIAWSMLGKGGRHSGIRGPDGLRKAL